MTYNLLLTLLIGIAGKVLGWGLLALAGTNILFNLFMTANVSVKDIWNRRKQKYYTKRAQQALKLKLESREKLF